MKVYKQSLISIFIERNIKLFHTKKIKSTRRRENILEAIIIEESGGGGVRNVENDKRMWR